MRGLFAAVAGLLAIALSAQGAEFKEAKVKKVDNLVPANITITVKENGKEKDVRVYLHPSKAKGVDTAGKELKGMELVKKLQEGSIVTISTEQSDGKIVGEEGKAEVAKELRIIKEN